jgi:alpha-L-fucosidase 2
MGGLLYGDGSVIKLALDCGSLWDERKSPAVLRKDFTWKHWMELKAAGRWEEIGGIFDRPYWEPTPTKIPGGRLDIVLALASMAESCRPETSGGCAAITPQRSEAATADAQRDTEAGACSMPERCKPEKDGGGAATTPQQSEAATADAQRGADAGACSHGTLTRSLPLVSRCALPASVFPARSHAPVLLPCSSGTARSALDRSPEVEISGQLSLPQSVSAFTLDMATAVGRAELAELENRDDETGSPFRYGEQNFRDESGSALECFFSAVDGVAMLRMPTSSLENWKFVPPAVLQEVLNYPAAEIQTDGDVRWFLQATPEGMRYATVAGQVVGGGETVIALAIASSADGADPLTSAKVRVAAALERGYEALLAEHAGWWRRYWETSRVSVPDDALQRHYNLTSYLLGSGSRRGAPPMPLQGVWTAEGGLPPWKGDYHHNLNTQMTYVSYLAAGHLDEGLAFFDFLWERLPAFRKFAREFYGAPGAMLPSVMSAAGTALCGWPMYSLMPQGNGSWIGWMFYRHWLYTRDEGFLRERAYPFCSELGECLAALLETDASGVLKMPMSSSPEIFDNTPQAYLAPNSNYDRDGMEALFGGLAHMAGELGLTADAARWEKLAGSLGGRCVEASGELMFADGVPFRQSHRHFSHLMAIHPYGQLSLAGSENDRRMISSSLAALERFGVEEWTGYSHAWASCLHARAGDAELALSHLATYCDAFISRNGFHLNGNQKGGPGWGNGDRPFTLEGNFIAMEAIHEMLLQTRGGVLVIFPATPDSWMDVEFQHLLAEGGWRVSADRRGGKTTRVEVRPSAGGTLRLQSPWPSLALNGRRIEADACGVVEVAAMPGEALDFSPVEDTK